MICRKCGAEIPEGFLYCKRCGAQVLVSHTPRRRHTSYVSEADRRANERRKKEYEEHLEKQREIERKIEEKRKAYEAERKARLRAQKKIRLALGGILIAICLGLSYISYIFSYEGLVKAGNKKVEEGSASEAEIKFGKAVAKDGKRAEAYKGLATLEQKSGDLEGAEKVYLDAISKYPSTVALYRACIEFYISTEQMTKISELLDGTSSSEVLNEMRAYVSAKPRFSLSEGSYDEVQQLTLSTTGEAIYYTIDNTEPTVASTKYSEPIQIGEGQTIVRAIAVNQEGVPSLSEMKTYTVELPIGDAPAISPSTGRYEQAMQIIIEVPEGNTAYYTTDNSDPTTSGTRKQYTEPIEMPAGNTIIKAVLEDKRGRYTPVSIRNYTL